MKPMLARGIERDPNDYLRDDHYAVELKCNGRRLLADGTSGTLQFFSSEGTRTDAPKHVANELKEIRAVLDGELMGDGGFWVFDMPVFGSLVQPSTPWHERREWLEVLFEQRIWTPEWIHLLPCATTTRRKRALARKIWAQGYEGYILKQVEAPYRNYRCSDWLKVKNVRTVDCIVASFGTDKHNMQLEVYCDGEPVEIGECSRYEGDAPRAKIGDVIEVAYLDAGKPDEPRLCQPHAKRLRRPDEKSPENCLLDQLDGSFAKKSVLV